MSDHTTTTVCDLCQMLKSRLREWTVFPFTSIFGGIFWQQAINILGPLATIYSTFILLQSCCFFKKKSKVSTTHCSSSCRLLRLCRSLTGSSFGFDVFPTVSTEEEAEKSLLFFIYVHFSWFSHETCLRSGTKLKPMRAPSSSVYTSGNCDRSDGFWENPGNKTM